MSAPLIDLSTLANHTLAFVKAANGLGFSSPGEINRFLFQSYGKAIREIPPADRPQGVIFLLTPAGSAGALARVAALKPVLVQTQTDVARHYYSMAADLSGGATVAHTPSSDEHKQMIGGAWTAGYAQMISRQTNRCVVWANGVGANVYLAGDCYIETPDVVEELPIGLPASFQSLSWDDGEIVFEFAQNELNDTSPAGIWRLPHRCLLQPKPEKLMSVALGKFLRHRMAGYRHHEDEPYVENEGRADLTLQLYNGFYYIIEVKWVGRSLKGPKDLEATAKIEEALKKGTQGWFTQCGNEAFAAGAKQLAKYFGTNRYKRAYLIVFDCHPAASSRKHEVLPVDPTHVAPHSGGNFRSLRACVDPRKASKSSKAKQS